MLTAEQKALLKAAIAADPVLGVLPNNYDTAYKVEAAFNSLTADWYVWRSSVSPDDWFAAMFGGGGATQLDALTASKRDSLFQLCSNTQNPTNAAIRAAVDDFCGSQNTLKAALTVVQKRLARRIEKVLSTGTGSSASPAVLEYEGTITYSDAKDAMDYVA